MVMKTRIDNVPVGVWTDITSNFTAGKSYRLQHQRGNANYDLRVCISPAAPTAEQSFLEACKNAVIDFKYVTGNVYAFATGTDSNISIEEVDE